jgi:hypothetical protein
MLKQLTLKLIIIANHTTEGVKLLYRGGGLSENLQPLLTDIAWE